MSRPPPIINLLSNKNDNAALLGSRTNRYSIKAFYLVHPLVLLSFGIILALIPAFYLNAYPEIALLLSLDQGADLVNFLWLVMFCGFALGTQIFQKASPPCWRISEVRLKNLVSFINFYLIGYLVILILFNGMIPLLAISSDSGISAVADFNAAQKNSNGLIGSLTVLNFISYGIVALYLTQEKIFARSPGKWILQFLFVCFVSLAETKVQNLVVFCLILGFSFLFRQGSGARLPLKFIVIMPIIAVLLIMLGGALNAMRSNLEIVDGAFDNGLLWIVRYTAYPFANASTIVETIGFHWIASSCYFIYFFIPALFRGDHCNLTTDIPQPEPSSPANFLSPAYSSGGVIGLFLFSVFCGWLAHRLYKLAQYHRAYVMPFALIAWATISVSSYNHYLNPYFTYYPGIIYMFIILKFLKPRTYS